MAVKWEQYTLTLNHDDINEKDEIVYRRPPIKARYLFEPMTFERSNASRKDILQFLFESIIDNMIKEDEEHGS